MDYLLLALLWIAYCFQHSYLISIGFTGLMKRKLKKYYAFYRLFYVIISFVLLIPVIYYGNNLKSEVIIHWNEPWNYLRFFLILASLLMFVKVFFIDYDSLSFMGIRQITGFRRKTEDPYKKGISRSGFLGIVRHPMYLAAIILLWCNTFRISDIVVNVVLTGYFIIGTKLEEKKLVMEFGQEYISYQNEVPMLIPFLKFKRTVA
jgi:protein-S-isoprenylcysteine O-methyltransferase Ste14